MVTPLDPHGPTLSGGSGRAAVRGPGPVRAAALPLVVGGAVLAGAVALGVTDPYRPGGHLVCPLLVLTGFFCPACGGQRAVHDLVRLDLAGAWAMNPLLVLAVPPAVVAWLRWLTRQLRGGGVGRLVGRRGSPAWCRRASGGPVPSGGRPATGPRLLHAAAPWLLLAVVVGFGVLRNVPALGPWLAP